MSRLREPVIGDELDLETYGRPAAQRATARRSAASVESGARGGRVKVAAPRTRGVAPGAHKERPARESFSGTDFERSQRERFGQDGVRTIKISGQATPPRRSSSPRGSAQRSLAMQVERYDRRPDRAAQWALFMGVFMIVVAIVTGT